jgi:hypothetical protein
MTEKNQAKQMMPLGLRVALCVAIGTSLTVSNGAAVGIAVAAGLWLALSFGARRC